MRERDTCRFKQCATLLRLRLDLVRFATSRGLRIVNSSYTCLHEHLYHERVPWALVYVQRRSRQITFVHHTQQCRLLSATHKRTAAAHVGMVVATANNSLTVGRNQASTTAPAPHDIFPPRKQAEGVRHPYVHLVTRQLNIRRALGGSGRCGHF